MNRLNLMDCMEGMKQFPDKYFELAIVDPPYGIGEDKTKRPSRGKTFIKPHITKSWDHKIPEKIYFDELKRVSENQIIWGGNYFVNYLKPSSGWLLWDKGQRKFSCADGELAYTSYNKAFRIFEFSRAKNNKLKRLHIAQKPVDLYKWILKNYAKKGDKIFDSHGGSMSIAIACHDLGFDLDLCEIDKDYFEAGTARFEQHLEKDPFNITEDNNNLKNDIINPTLF